MFILFIYATSDRSSLQMSSRTLTGHLNFQQESLDKPQNSQLECFSKFLKERRPYLYLLQCYLISYFQLLKFDLKHTLVLFVKYIYMNNTSMQLVITNITVGSVVLIVKYIFKKFNTTSFITVINCFCSKNILKIAANSQKHVVRSHVVPSPIC